MLEALGVADAEQLIVCTRAEPRARSTRCELRRTPRWTSASPPSGSTSSTPCRPRSARALEVTPADGQVIVTGSLYTVGAARSVLVPDA